MTALASTFSAPSRSHALLALLLVVAAVAVVGPFMVELAPVEVNTRERLLPPFSVLASGTVALFGTDQLGRDVFGQVIEGGRTSLMIAVSAALLSALAGTAIGIAAGWSGGRTESAIMRFVDVQLSFPSILIAVFLAAFMPPSVLSVIGVLAITRWAQVARLTRAITVRARQQGYVEAALVTGLSTPKIIWTCILPNLAGPLLIVLTAELSELILAEAALGFLGIGTPATVQSWGRTIANGRNYLDNAWWIATLPGLVIAAAVIALGLSSEALRGRLTRSGWTML